MVTVIVDDARRTTGLDKRIKDAVAEVELSVSSWRDDSDVSRINRTDVGQGVIVAFATSQLLERAVALHGMSLGTFDITIAPLLDVWGFSRRTKGTVFHLPSDDLVAAAKGHLGVDGIVIAGATVTRAKPIAIDVTAIGDGAAAAAVMAMLRSAGFVDALVDVAGEVVGIGGGVDGPWRVGINTPSHQALPSEVIHTVELVNDGQPHGLSTSGTYREQFNVDGQVVNHIIDPRSGKPVASNLVSCTIIADDIVVADALSTACLVLGEADTRAVLAGVPGAQGIWIHDDAGRLRVTLPDDR
jgi:FAD:protein FMN transferase